MGRPSLSSTSRLVGAAQIAAASRADQLPNVLRFHWGRRIACRQTEFALIRAPERGRTARQPPSVLPSPVLSSSAIDTSIDPVFPIARDRHDSGECGVSQRNRQWVKWPLVVVVEDHGPKPLRGSPDLSDSHLNDCSAEG